MAIFSFSSYGCFVLLFILWLFLPKALPMVFTNASPLAILPQGLPMAVFTIVLPMAVSKPLPA